MPDEPEVSGMLALMLLQHSRRDARVGGDGELITLEQQDRERWDREEIREGLGLLEAALGRRQRRSLSAAGGDRGLPCPGGQRRANRLG